MPFGLENTGVTYQWLVNKMSQAQIGRNMEVYVDDMLVKSAKSIGHTRDLNEAFETWQFQIKGKKKVIHNNK
jgi:hypothetical protein